MTGERRLRFWKDRATRNFWVYKEEYARGDQPIVGSIYVSKEALAAMGDPEELEVTISPRAV